MPSYWICFVHPVDGVHGGIRVSARDPEKALDAVAKVNPGPRYEAHMMDEDAFIASAREGGVYVSNIPIPSQQYIPASEFDRYGLTPYNNSN